MQNVALIWILATGHISSQFHIFYDDSFTMVKSLHLVTVTSNWPELYACQGPKNASTHQTYCTQILSFQTAHCKWNYPCTLNWDKRQFSRCLHESLRQAYLLILTIASLWLVTACIPRGSVGIFSQQSTRHRTIFL